MPPKFVLGKQQCSLSVIPGIWTIEEALELEETILKAV